MCDKYRVIRSDEEALTWLNDNYREFIIKNQEEIDKDDTLANALHCYTGSMSRDYNDILDKANGNIDNIRLDDDITGNDRIFHKDTLQNIRLIYDGFNYNQINENIVLYHYINLPCDYLITLIKENDNKLVYKRFVSTTLVKKSEGIRKLILEKNYNILFKINVPKGTRCIPILWTTKQTNLREFEIILEPNLSLELLKIRRKIFSKIKYELEFNIL